MNARPVCRTCVDLAVEPSPLGMGLVAARCRICGAEGASAKTHAAAVAAFDEMKRELRRRARRRS